MTGSSSGRYTGLGDEFNDQKFTNEYELVDGVAMNRQHPENFHIPHAVIKKHVAAGYFVELRIDSPRFSTHEDAVEKCYCASCNGEATKPILRHEHPASLLPIPPQDIPSRGWGEDFWVQVVERDEEWLAGTVDNPLCESRLHGLVQGQRVLFGEQHILAVHGVHREAIVAEMNQEEMLTLARWLESQNDSPPTGG